LRKKLKILRAQRFLVLAGSAVSLWAFGTSQVGNAIANGDTRTIEIYHTHTQESLNITYKRNGSYDAAALEKLNWLLRDWRRDEPTKMDPRLFDIVWETHRAVGSQEPINVVSAYRAPETNSMLRRRSRAVAKHSQHTQGRAMDFYLTDVSMGKVREIALKMHRGGVGYYPTAYNPFVHLDSGSVRHWPRMTRDQLARVFPDGKTVHLPADGKPMPGYEVALAEIESNGGTVPSSGYNAIDEEGVTPSGKSFFARLFSGGEEEDDELARTPRRGGRAVAARQPNRTQVASADANDPQNDNFFARVFGGGNRQQPAARQPARIQTASLPSETVIEPSPPVQAARTAAPAQPPAPPVVELKVANVPLPVARPPEFTRIAVASAGPQTVWVQGPAGKLAPLQGKVADVPLPPQRPGDLPGRTQVAANQAAPSAATPALKPLEGKPASVPLPPQRPAQLARVAEADLEIVGTIGRRPLAAPANALGYASQQDVMPAVLRGPVGPRQDNAQAPALDRAGLKALFSEVSIAQASPGALAAPQTQTLSSAKTVVTKFGQDPANGISTDRFTGPAVKPLSTLQ
jgi:uncharacterized protein YcbK (DUF882 family)